MPERPEGKASSLDNTIHFPCAVSSGISAEQQEGTVQGGLQAIEH
jgi:hypothetical protein